MRKLISYTLVFALGFALCALALRQLNGQPLSFAQDQNKQVVLAALEKPVATAPSIVGEGVIAAAAAKIEPSVVTIDTMSKTAVAANPFMGDPLFQQFFGRQAPQQPQSQTESGTASGVIISPDGYILTNNHVVSGASTVKVNLWNGKELEAKVIGSDPTTDIAVVKIDDPGEALPAVDFGESGQLRVGDMVIAVGNPLNVGTTVTFGIVSALGHRNDMQAGSRPLAANIIQTDAAINPGNSGGALADMNGRIVGINEAIYSPTGAYVGIGFAIPIDSAKLIADQLIRSGKIIRAYLGVEYGPLKDLDAQSRQQLGINIQGDNGLIVSHVFPNSPAAAAGLKEYDVILEANRQTLDTSNNLQALIQKMQPGQTLVLKVYRDGQDLLVPIKLTEMPQDFGAVPEMGQGQGEMPQQPDYPDQGNPMNQ